MKYPIKKFNALFAAVQRSYPASSYTTYYKKVRISRKKRANKGDCYMHEYFFFEIDRTAYDNLLVVDVEYSPGTNGFFVNLGYSHDFTCSLNINVVITREYCGLKALIKDIEKSPTIIDLEAENMKKKISVNINSLISIFGPRQEGILTLLKEEWARRILDKNNFI